MREQQQKSCFISISLASEFPWKSLTAVRQFSQKEKIQEQKSGILDPILHLIPGGTLSTSLGL